MLFQAEVFKGEVPLSVLPPVVISSRGQGLVGRRVAWAMKVGDEVMTHAQGEDTEVLGMVGGLVSGVVQALIAAGESREDAECRVLGAVLAGIWQGVRDAGGDGGGASSQTEA